MFSPQKWLLRKKAIRKFRHIKNKNEKKRMQNIFEILNPNFFTVLSGKNKALYAECLINLQGTIRLKSGTLKREEAVSIVNQVIEEFKQMIFQMTKLSLSAQSFRTISKKTKKAICVL